MLPAHLGHGIHHRWGVEVVEERRLWQPDAVGLRTALGQALHRAPEGLRRGLPRTVRDHIRRRIGPFAPWEAGFTHDPPALAAGERVGPPDFVGIGAQKAGTTWWFSLVAAHPGVSHRAEIHKERHYFARYATDAFGPDEARRYQQWFPRVPGTITGEWTPDYMYQPWVPPLLDMAAPEARLLVLFRDPVERFISGVEHSDMVPGSHRGTVLAEALWRGFYAASLRRWSSAFEEGRVLVLQYEECVADPEGQLARTYRFLGLEDGYRPVALHPQQSPPRQGRATLDEGARRRLVDIYAADVVELVDLVPDIDLGLWPNFGAR